MTTLRAEIFDITTYTGDAIVNAANRELKPGGGVCGAIFRASPNPELLEYECSVRGPCPTGSARLTSSYGMPAACIIHAVGPIWTDGTQNEEQLLYDAYYNSLLQAQAHDVTSIAFPAISTGIYGFPLEKATGIAVKACNDFIAQYPDALDEIALSCFDEPTLELYERTLDEAQQQPPSMVFEKEWKFLVPAWTDIAGTVKQLAAGEAIDQWYLSKSIQIEPSDKGFALGTPMSTHSLGTLNAQQVQTLHALSQQQTTTRLRHRGDEWYLTVKGAAPAALATQGHLEFEIPIDAAMAKELKAFAIASVSKTRYTVDFGSYTWEIDEFKGPLEGLCMAELEKPTHDNRSYPPNEQPSWIGMDVTHDPRFKNEELAMHGAPDLESLEFVTAPVMAS